MTVVEVSEPRFERAVARFDAVHRDDPESMEVDGSAVPRAQWYHARLRHWVERLDGKSSEAMRLAARCQHLRRWAIPRADYPPGPGGYRRWREALTELHVLEASAILRDAGYDEVVIERVRDFLTKKGLKQDPEVQRFEDAICLVFFEIELAGFARRRDDGQLVRILQKVLRKMSRDGRELASQMVPRLSPEVRSLVETALVRADLVKPSAAP